MKRKYFNKYKLLILLMTGVFLVGSYFESFQGVENWGYGLVSYGLKEDKQRNKVVVVAIDDQALKQIGEWPWPRTLIARLVKQINKSRPRSVTLMLDLSSSQTSPIHKRLVVEATGLQDQKLRRQLKSYLTQLDTDRDLADLISNQRNLVISSFYRYSSRQSGLPSNFIKHIIKDSETDKPFYYLWLNTLNAHPVMLNIRILPPDKQFISNATTGLVELKNSGQSVNSVPLVLRAGERYLPGMPLVLTALQHNVNPGSIKIINHSTIRLGKRKIRTAKDYRFYPLLPKDWTSKTPVRVIPVTELGKTDSRTMRGKHVIVGLTAKHKSDYAKLPNGTIVSLPVWQAHIAQSLMLQKSVNVPYWFYAIQRFLILGFALYLLLIPARFYKRAGYITTLVLAVVLLNAGFLVFVVQQLWIPLITPVIFLVFTQSIIFFSYRKTLQIQKAKVETSEARKELGSFYQSQGNLNQAFEQYQTCEETPDLAKTLYNLGLDFERRRQFDRALEVYEHIHNEQGTFYKDSETRIVRLREVTSNFPSHAQSSNAATQIMVVEDSVVEKPMLGRYQLERELGRGAMGMVYLGLDPKIARKVAIKTLALGEEFEGKALEESEKRFFREAEAVGRLNHPNIIQIYDAGEDQGVAYIAMDFVEGDTLSKYMFKDDLLSVKEVLQIGVKVADALAYAHKQKVIHRDVKPANIMYHPESGVVKVADFGIAALTDDSKTKTGTVLGSPSYMSPEQISGKKVTGKSDQFSLGVTLYQLLTGTLPFDGDSMANLMFQITNQTHRPIRKIRRGIAPCISRIINKALQKLPENRFNDCTAMSEAMEKCLEQL